jgi:cell division GTPase FtsZ
MKRRTFLKASTLPIWASIDSSFISNVFASAQDHQRRQYIDVSVLNFKEIREKMVLSDHFDQRNIQIIGFGTSGRKIALQLHTDNKDGIHDIRCNQESGDLEEIVAYEPTRLNTIAPFPPLAKADTGGSERLLNYTIDIDKPDTVIFVGDLDYACDFNAIAKGFDLVRKKSAFSIGVITVPYDFRQNESIEINATLSKLEKSLDSLFVIRSSPELKDGDNPFGLPDPYLVPVESLPKTVASPSQKAIESTINWYLASRPHSLRQFDLMDIKTVLLEGRAEIIEYTIPEVIIPIDFVKDLIVKDLDKRKLKNGLIHFHGDGNQSLEEMNEILDCIGEHIDMDGYWCFYATSDADSDVSRPLKISIVSTG